MFLLYMIWYGLERMIVEGLRTDSLYTPLFGLRVSQVLSGIIVIIGVSLLIINLRRAAKKPAAETDKDADEEKDAETEPDDKEEKEDIDNKTEEN